ncbi:nitrous oxide reductase [Streptomyces afghaniensis]|nr:nitrous oxide reductase [Streptomyces afghaniensis]
MEGNRIGRRTVLRTAGALAAATAVTGCGTLMGSSESRRSGGGKSGSWSATAVAPTTTP